MLTPNFDPFPVLFTERLMLRQINTEDANEIFLLRSDEKVMQYLDRPRARSTEDALELIQKIVDGIINNDGITWGMVLKDDTKLIGTIGYWRIMKEDYRAEIGYMIDSSFHGKGLMQEAISAVINYGFSIMKLHSVEANVNPDNLPSIKLLERNRFIREAYFKENYYFEGRFLDSAIYSFLTPGH